MSNRWSTRRASNACWVCLLVNLLSFGFGVNVGTAAAVGSVRQESQASTASEVASASQDASAPAATESAATAPAATEPKEAVPTLAITNAMVHTMEREGTLERATVLVAGNRIVAVGRDVVIPENVTVIDAKGAYLTPGLIDVRSRLFLAEGADQAADGSLNAVDGLNRFDSVDSEVLAAGVTTVYLQPAGSFGGFGATVATSLDAADDANRNGILKTDAAAQMSLTGSAAETSRARKQRYEALQKRLQEIKDYQKAWDDYREALAKFEAKEKEKGKENATTPPPPTAASPEAPPAAAPERPVGGRGRRPMPRPDGGSLDSGSQDITETNDTNWQDPRPEENRPRSGPPQEPTTPPAATAGAATTAETSAAPKKPGFDALKERLLPVLKREVPVRFEVHRAEEIQWALALAKEFNLRLILEGLSDMKSAAPAVRESQLPVVIGPWLAFSNAEQAKTRQATTQWGDAFGSTGTASTGTTSTGTASPSHRVVIATFSDAPLGSKWLRYHASAAVSAGLSREQALRGMTIEAAGVAGVSDQVGSIKVGKLANLVLFTGDPLDTVSAVALVVANGKVVVDRSSLVGTSPGDSVVGSSVPGTLNLPARLPTAYAIVSQRVLSGNGTWQHAAVVVKDRMISAVTAPDQIPAGLPVFNVGNSPLTPGLQSAWVVNSAATNPIARESDAAQQFAADGFDPASPIVKGALATGLFGLHLVNSPSNVIAGQSAWLSLGQLKLEQLSRSQPAAEQWTLSGAARSEERYPATLVGQVAMVRQRLNGQLSESTLVLPAAALQKLSQQKAAQLEAIQTGKRPVFIDARTDAEIDAAIRLVTETKVQAWICGPNQLRPFIKQLADLHMGVVVLPPNDRTYDWYFQDLVQAYNAGVPCLLSGEDGSALRTTAAALVNAGLDPVVARQLLMLETGKRLAHGQSTGLVPGAAADWVVWSDDPLNLSAKLLGHSGVQP